ncbi:hypothetical protein B0A55_04739 [Friedmanniomyces simplex]|uniref:Uncharacterized protein n=1 Tax=Friedmanniomyces simplex TaxID=329884 RepID=A0A4U0XLU5_9PEZI|nr:hypothetical protein B0A55_04739 [Friedmanniomyces simplex]
MRTFDFFLSWTAPRLAGSLDKNFWCGYVLQIAQSEPLVLDSILAISTLYEHPQYLASFLQDSEPIKRPIDDGMNTPAPQTPLPAKRPALDVHHAKALVAYNRAIDAVRKKMETGTATPLLALLSCTLCFCIEVIRDNVFAALALFSKGSDMLGQFAATKFVGQERHLVETIKLMFGRIGVLAAALGHPSLTEAPSYTLTAGELESFSNLEDARTSLYALMADSHAFIRKAAAFKTSSSAIVSDDAPGSDSSTESNPLKTRLSEYEPARLSEMGPAVLPNGSDSAVRGGRSGSYGFPYNDHAPIHITLPSSHKGRTRILQESQGCYGLLPCLCDCEEDVCCACQTAPSATVTGQPGSVEAFLEPLAESARLSRQQEIVGFRLTMVKLLEEQKVLADRLREWYETFPWTSTPPREVEQSATSSLLMHYHVSSIWLTTRLTASQLVFDKYTCHFQQVVPHAEAYVKALDTQKPIFTFEVGAVPPLYFAATKCRIPSLRRKALQLLSLAPRKECIWGATSTAQLAARIIAIEEEGLGLPAPAWDGSSRPGSSTVTDSVLPAESKRVHSLELLKNKTTGGYEVRVTRYHGLDGKLFPVVQAYPV